MNGTSANHALSDLTEGTHSLSVRQTDDAGNASDTATTSTWTVDLTPPAKPVFTGVPSQFSNLTSVVLKFSSPEPGVSSVCVFDNQSVVACGSPVSLNVLKEGTHQLTVGFVDLAGNLSVAQTAWLTDVTAPALKPGTGLGKVKLPTQTSYRLQVMPDLSGVAKVEYSTSTRSPSKSAPNVAAKTVPFAATTIFKTTGTIKWLRMKDAAGNWSNWFGG